MMDPASPPPPAPRLLTGAAVRAVAALSAPGYGEQFTAADWERIAERLEALARLLWEVSQDQVQAEAQKQAPPPPAALPGEPG